jgi:hypothetical protein
MNADGGHDELTDIGHDVRVQVRRILGEPLPEGVYYEHPCVVGKPSPGWCPVKPNNPDGWDLVSESPLTLSPSLLCRTCGHHGHIRGGRWEPC